MAAFAPGPMMDADFAISVILFFEYSSSSRAPADGPVF